MIPVKHIDPDDLALYAMQLLPAEETAEMTENLQHSAEARRVLAEIYGDLALFAHTTEMHAAPEGARQKLMKTVAREKKSSAGDPQEATYAPRGGGVMAFEEAPSKRNAAKVLPWIGWAVAAGLAVFSGTLYQQRNQSEQQLSAAQERVARTAASAALANTALDTLRDTSAAHFTLTGTDQKPPPQGRVTYVRSSGAVILTASNLDSLPLGKTYELWLIPADGPTPIAAGTFRPDARGFATVVLPELPKGLAAKMFAVTIEDGDGSQVPTMPIVLKGAAA